MADSRGNRERWLVRLMALILIVGTAACYWPVRHCDFVSLDDPMYVSQAPMVERGLTWGGVKWAFKSVVGGNWNPLVWISHMVDSEVYGPAAGGRHVTNVILHIANVLLLFAVLRGMTGTLWRSGVVAALFAWHPLHVESVAWIAERKDVLSTLFWLLAIGAYVKWTNVQCPRPKVYYAFALLFFIFGLMSKPMVVTLPVVLLVMDWWPLQRIAEFGVRSAEFQKGQPTKPPQISLRQALVEKIPFFVLSAVAGVVAIYAQGAVKAMGDQALGLRLENAAVSCVTYVAEFFWPVKLAVFYPYPETIAVWRVVGAIAVIVVISIGVIWARKERPYLAAGWLWFLVTLLPVIGVVQVGMQAMADRYTYLPYMGLGLMVVWGLGDLARLGAQTRMVTVALAVGGLAVCMGVTMAQVKYWRDSTTLYRRALAVTSGNFIAHGNLGSVLQDEGKLDEAVKELLEDVRLKPKVAKPYNDLGKAYALQGKLAEATEMFSNAVRLDPGFAQARRNFGNALLQKGMVEEGLAEMKTGVALEPEDVGANRRMAEALVKLGRAAEARPYCEMVVKAEPRDAHARFMLGEINMAQKHFAEAVADLKEAARLARTVPQVLNSLAWIYATCRDADLRNGAEAVRLAEQACKINNRRDVELLDTLGAAYAEAGRFADAVKTAEETRALAEAAKDAKTVEMERQRLELYRAGKAYHEEQ